MVDRDDQLTNKQINKLTIYNGKERKQGAGYSGMY